MEVAANHVSTPRQLKRVGSSSFLELVCSFSMSFPDHNHLFDCMGSTGIQSFQEHFPGNEYEQGR